MKSRYPEEQRDEGSLFDSMKSRYPEEQRDEGSLFDPMKRCHPRVAAVFRRQAFARPYPSSLL
jgi:hypothetical protein